MGLRRGGVFPEELGGKGVRGLGQELDEVPVEPVRVLLDKVVRAVRHLSTSQHITSHRIASLTLCDTHRGSASHQPTCSSRQGHLCLPYAHKTYLHACRNTVEEKTMMVRVLLLALANRLPNLYGSCPCRRESCGENTSTTPALCLSFPPSTHKFALEPNQRLSCPFLSRFRRSA